MAALKQISSLIGALLGRWRAWHRAQVAGWDDRHIIQYEKRVNSTIADVKEAQRRRNKAGR